MKKELIEFYANDGVKLNGYINTSKSKSDSVLIEVHGMSSNCFKKREAIISETVEKIGIDTICINTRGSEIVKYIKYKNGKKELAGTAYEDVEESYYDIIGAINYAITLGYSSIYLQGHSLGATKIVYTYTKMKENNIAELEKIKGIILLSLVDIPDMIETYSNHEFMIYAEKKEKEGDILNLMPTESFIHPISVKTYLKYTKYNKEIDFAQYDNKNYKFEELNSIDLPLFMRWGNCNELIKKNAEEQVKLMRNLIKNSKADINFIDGADHSYSYKEQELANEILNFLNKYK